MTPLPPPKAKTKRSAAPPKNILGRGGKCKKKSKIKIVTDNLDEYIRAAQAESSRRREALKEAARRDSNLKELLISLSKTRKSLPYDEEDPVKRRHASIGQMKAIRAYLLSRDIGYPLISPFSDIIDALEKLDGGLESSLFKYRKRREVPMGYIFRMAEASAYVEYLCNKTTITKHESAAEVLKIGKKYGLGEPRTQNVDAKSKADSRSKKEALIEWAKQCKCGKKGKSALNHYKYVLGYINRDHENSEETKKLTPQEIVERTMSIYEALKREDGPVLLF